MTHGALTTGVALLVGALFLCQEVDIESADTATSTTAEVLNLSKTTSGTPASGIGAGIRFEVEDAGGPEEQASIDASLADTTNGSEDASLDFRVNVAGTMTTVMQIDGIAGRIGIGGDPGTKFEVASSTEETAIRVEATASGSTAEVILEGDDDASVFLQDFSLPATVAALIHDAGDNRFVIQGYNSGVNDRIRMGDTDVDCDGDGTFTNNAFGPSEWVIGQARPGEIVCTTGTPVDEDGLLRARVEPCTHDHCRRVVGVATPEDEGVVHGNPSFDYKDEIDDGVGWWGPWRENHVGVELTGFRHVRVVGQVQVGDLLVSSGVRGHARARRPGDTGDIVGVAAQSFDGTGLNGEPGEVWTRVHLQRVPDLTSRIHTLDRGQQSLEARAARLRALLDTLDP